MTENEISGYVVSACFKIHTNLGPGLFESVYEEILYYELCYTCGLNVRRQEPAPVIWENKKLETAFRADLLIEKKVLVELKSVERLLDVHFKQVLTYLRLTGCKLGLLINFEQNLIKNGIRRVVNNL